MKKLESSLMNMVLVLTGVAVIMGGILAYVNHLTEGPINDQKAKALADGIKSVMGVSDITVAKTDTVRQNDAKGKEHGCCYQRSYLPTGSRYRCT